MMIMIGPLASDDAIAEEGAAGKGDRHSSRPVRPSIFIADGPSKIKTSSVPGLELMITGGGTEVTGRRVRKLHNATPLAESSAKVTPSLFVPTTSKPSRERRCATNGRAISPTAARHPPLVTIELAGRVWGVMVGVGLGIIGCRGTGGASTSIVAADENSPKVFVSGAILQKYSPGARSFISVSVPLITRSKTMSWKLRSGASCNR